MEKTSTRIDEAREEPREHADQPVTKRGSLHMIGNAHLDPVWLWQWQEGFQEAKATFRSVLELMRESPDFLFTSSSAAIYEWIETNDPEMFAEIRERVAEGRWEIVGGWWIQPDCNLPSGEAMVRQALYGQRYFAEKLGTVAKVGYNVDSFGHAGSLPQILLKSGLGAYVFTRPHPHEQKLPARLFWWEANDGSRVLAFRIPYEYNTWGKDVRLQVERCAAELTPRFDQLMCFYGVGNHGGGPTRENLASVRELSSEDSLPELKFSTPTRYFDAIAKLGPDLPVVHDELQHHASGCYSAHSGIKRWNRLTENRLIMAEKMSSLAQILVRHPYPSDFERAWKDVLFNQFHDIIAGTSIEPAYDDARNLYGEAISIAERNLNQAVQAISWKIGIEQADGSRPIAVFNPHSWDVRAPVEVEFGPIHEDDRLFDADSNEVRLQLIQPQATVSGGRSRLCFVADVPAWGYAVYTVRRMSTDQPVTSRPMNATDRFIENDFLRLEINPETGCLTTLYDKRVGFEFLRSAAPAPLVLGDPSDTWSHGVIRYDKYIGRFSPISVQLVENGPVRSVIRVISAYESSKLTQDFVLYWDLDHVEVRVTVDWHEHQKLLKLSFPVNVFYSSVTAEVPYGFIERPANGEEEPFQSWVDLSGIGRNLGKRVGLSILNDGKYSYDASEKEINLTVLRSPIYSHHIPAEPDPNVTYTYIDQGTQRFTYHLVPHGGGWQAGQPDRRAAELNQPLVVLPESAHQGSLPKRSGNITVRPENVSVTAIKRAENSDDLILRCVEMYGTESEAVIDLPVLSRQIRSTYRPSEIKTFRVPINGTRQIVEANLLEWEDVPG